MDIAAIRKAIKKNDYEISFHAVQKTLVREIWKEDIESAILNGKIIEEYPDDTPYPSCLILGYTMKNEPLHIVVAYALKIRVITAYLPNENKWIEYKKRRKAK